MKRLLILIIFLSGCQVFAKTVNRIIPSTDSTEYEASSPIKILIAGQSNGASPANNAPPAYTVTNRVHVKHIDYQTSWIVPKRNNPVTKHNVAFVYLGDLLASMFNRDVYIYNIARGNTSTENWVDLYMGDFYTAIKNFKPDVVLWIQGETDAVIQYQKSESLKNMRKIFEYAEVDPSRLYIALTRIVDVQEQIISEGYGKRGVDIEAMRNAYPEYFEVGQGEFDNEGLEAHGKAWFEILKHNIR